MGAAGVTLKGSNSTCSTPKSAKADMSWLKPVSYSTLLFFITACGAGPMALVAMASHEMQQRQTCDVTLRSSTCEYIYHREVPPVL